MKKQIQDNIVMKLIILSKQFKQLKKKKKMNFQKLFSNHNQVKNHYHQVLLIYKQKKVNHICKKKMKNFSLINQ